MNEISRLLGTAILQLVEIGQKEVPSQTDQDNAFATPEKSKDSREAQEEQISPSTLEAAQILTNVAFEGFKGSQAPLGSKIYRRKPKSTPTPTKILHFEEPAETQVNTGSTPSAKLIIGRARGKSCKEALQHVKTPRQPIRTPVTPSSIPSYNRQNWNQRMERDLGAGYSFERKPCFVCGSLSHLIKDCDYYEKKMAREAALKSKRVVHADVRQATPAWTNTNRVNKANQFTPRPVQLSNIRPNLSTASNTIKTGRVNVNTGHGNVSSGSVHVNSGTQIKSGASRFNTGKQHVNSGSMHVNSGTQIKSGGSRFNTGKQNFNSGRVHVNTARVHRPVLSNQTSNKTKFSQVNLKSPKKCFSKQSSPVNRPFSRNTAYKSNKYAVKGKMGTAVKTSAGCVWRKAIPLSNTNSGPTPDSNVNVSRGPQGRPKPVKAWFTMSNRHKDWLVQEQTALGKDFSNPFYGAKGLTSPEQTATGKGISNPLMAVMVCQKPYGIQLTNVSRVNTPGSDENRLKLYDLILGDDASKQGRIDIGDINTDAEITLIDETQGRINDIIADEDITLIS
ncbi:hypothetical protein Tco_1218709 [Tanacetum coccineum]